MYHNELITINMRDFSRTERRTHYNAFKTSNSKAYIDKEFPPEIRSVFPNYKESPTPGLSIDYITHSGQIVAESMIRSINFQSFSQMTALKSVYIAKKPDSFHVFPSYIINPIFPIVVHVLNRCRPLFSKIFPKRKIDESGLYRVGLFLDLKWQEIEIDDQLPIISNTILSTWCNTQEVWPALLEKAIAKVLGGWEYLSVMGHGYLDKARNKSRPSNRRALSNLDSIQGGMLVNPLETNSIVQNLENILRICTGCFSKRYYFKKQGNDKEELLDYLTFWEKQVKLGNCIILKTNDQPQGISERNFNNKLMPNHM
jgi:hypothetical protein